MDTKKCTKCEQEKTLENFSKNASKASGLSFECKECHKIIRKAYYENNKVKEQSRIKERRVELKKTYKEFKKTLKCTLCNEDHPATLQFHHLDPNEKEIEVSLAVTNGWSFKRIEEEIKKCIVLCANCHMKEHYEIKQGTTLL